jgi:hypothetical protein
VRYPSPWGIDRARSRAGASRALGYPSPEDALRPQPDELLESPLGRVLLGQPSWERADPHGKAPSGRICASWSLRAFRELAGRELGALSG